MRAKSILKIFNPLIWIINFLSYLGHLETYRNHSDKYEKYNFSKDIKYFS